MSRAWYHLRGIVGIGPLLMLASAFLFAVFDGLVKLLRPEFTVWDIGFYRFGCGMVILLLIHGWRHNPFNGHNRRLLAVRGIAGSAAFLCTIVAIRVLPISSAIVLFYSFPAFAAFFSPLLFREAISKTEILCILGALCGVGVLFDFHLHGTLAGQLLALLGAVFAGLTISIIKKLRDRNGPVVIYLYFCLLGSIITLPAFAANPHLPRFTGDWFMIGGIVCTALVAQLLMNQGFRYCKSWEGGLFLMAEVVFASILGIVFLGDPVTWRFWLGGLCIFGSAILLNRGNAQRVSPRGLGEPGYLSPAP